MTLIITLLSALVSFLIGFVAARLLRLGGLVVVMLAIMGIIGAGWLLGLDRMPGPGQALLALVMLQAGFLGGALVFASAEAGESRKLRGGAEAERPMPAKTKPHG